MSDVAEHLEFCTSPTNSAFTVLSVLLEWLSHSMNMMHGCEVGIMLPRVFNGSLRMQMYFI